jgi:hypothetical protein
LSTSRTGGTRSDAPRHRAVARARDTQPCRIRSRRLRLRVILTLRQASPGRVQTEHHPMHEASLDRRVRVVDEQDQTPPPRQVPRPTRAVVTRRRGRGCTPAGSASHLRKPSCAMRTPCGNHVPSGTRPTTAKRR